MKLVSYLVRHRRLSWVVLAGVSVLLALALGTDSRRDAQAQRVGWLQAQAQRSSQELLSQTLNGNLMGSVKLLGLIDDNIKLEASGQPLPGPAPSLPALTTLGETFAADGVFVVGADGFVKSSWDRDNKSSTGLDVRFRPYYQIAMQGNSTVYAAISMARGERALYFAAPIHAQNRSSSPVIGVLVARTPVGVIDAMLQQRADGALLLSPQGIVFASSRPDWLGMIEGAPDAQRLQHIRDLKQFGALFEKTAPQVLPLAAVTGLQQVQQQHLAVAVAKVDWRDPAGAWTLLLLEDLAGRATWSQALWPGALLALALMLSGVMALRLLQVQQTQQQTSQQLAACARMQQANKAYRSQLTELSAKLQRCRQPAELAHTCLQEARLLLGAIQGVLYLADPRSPDVLQLAGASACASAPPGQLAVGETLLGQCALERRLQIIATPPQGYWTLRSGLGQSPPGALVLAPMLLQDKLIGVLELALLVHPDETSQEKLADFLALVAGALEILSHHLHVQQDAPHAQALSTVGSPA